MDELERSLDRLRLEGDASRQLLDGVLASEDVIGAFADAEAFARALAALPRRRPAVVERPMPRLALATVVLASTMTVGTAFAQDLPAIAELAVARVVALIEGPVPLEAAAEASVPGASRPETPTTNRRAPAPVSPPTPAAVEIEPEPEPAAPSAALEPTPVAEPPEGADVEPQPAQPERAAEEPVPASDRTGPPQRPGGGHFEIFEPISERAPDAESAPGLTDASPAPESPSLPEATAEEPVASEQPDVPTEAPPDDEPGDDEDSDDDEGEGEKKDHPDHPEHPDHPDHPDHPAGDLP